MLHGGRRYDEMLYGGRRYDDEESGSLLAMTLSNYEFNRAKLVYARIRMRTVNYVGA